VQELTFLIVDDDVDDIEMLEEALRKIVNKAITISKRNCYEALEWLQGPDKNPDFIFLDLNMPPLNGFLCLKKLKESEEWKNIPAIIYTTSKLKEDKERCLKAGALYFVTKPSSFDELVETLSLIFKKELLL
jgi:CheY-like chemotaxis protein